MLEWHVLVGYLADAVTGTVEDLMVARAVLVIFAGSD